MPIENEIKQAFKGQRIGSVNPVIISAHLTYISQMVGCVAPTSEQFSIVEELLKTNYKAFTLEEMRLAFKMNITGEFGDVIEHYQNFSPDYFAKVMTAYRRKASQLRDFNHEVLPQLPAPETAPIDIVESCFKYWLELKPEERTFERIHFGNRLFDAIQESGLKTWTKEDGQKAKNKLQELINFKLGKMNLLAANSFRKELTPDRYKTLGKQVAVAMFFNEQILEGKTTLK